MPRPEAILARDDHPLVIQELKWNLYSRIIISPTHVSKALRLPSSVLQQPVV
jgi:hypothetical protein